jgi:Zn-dependent protease
MSIKMGLLKADYGGQPTLFKRTIATAGALSGYAWYAVVMFVWYLLHNIYSSAMAASAGSPIETIWNLAYGYILHPIFIAGLFWGISEQQRTHGNISLGVLFTGARRNYWRMAAANCLPTAFLIVGAVVTSLALGPGRTGSVGDVFTKYVDSVLSVVTLFWFAAIVVEGHLFSSLLRAAKTVLLNPIALTIGVVWGLTCFADAVLVTTGVPALDVADAAVLAVMKVLTAVYALAVYRQLRGDALELSVTESPGLDSASTASGERLVKISFGFAFAAFLPLLNVVALVLGILAIKRSKRFTLRAGIACCVGGFFTVFYAIFIAGLLMAGPDRQNEPSYAFLTETNKTLAPQVALLEKGSFEEAQQQLERNSTESAGQDWTLDGAMAIAKFREGNSQDALKDFLAAAQKKPDRSEFYFYYGLALLDQGQDEMAAGQFQTAATYAPKLDAAERYATLIDTAYSPSQGLSAAFFVVILLVLFALHEYGHAFAAWKLGDNTAKELGRLTLNPIKHLDLFGSIILPAILLFRQSDMVFGWAKPVPVNPANFKDPRKDHMRVSFSGPAVNLLVSMGCFFVIACVMLSIRLLWPGTITLRFAAPSGPLGMVGPPFAHELVVIIAFLKQLMYTSLTLGFLNLLPLPPLDGAWILSGILPQRLSTVFESLYRFGFVIIILLWVTPVLDYYLSVPLGVVWAGLHILVSAWGLS